MNRLVSVSGFVVIAMAVTAVVLSAQELPTRAPVLHQDVQPPAPGSDRAPENDPSRSLFGPTPEEGQNPTAFANGSKILPEPTPQPAGDGERKPAEPVHGRPGFAADRDTETRPDLQTGSDDTLQYVTVFNPSVLPWKRMSSLDSVADDYRLFTANNNTRSPISVGGKSESGRDMFWGDLVIELSPGVDIPIPSVAPDMRILSYETTPRVALEFSRDGADNFYVRSDESEGRGTHRLVFLADASADYFAPDLSDLRYTPLGRMPRLVPRGLLREMSPEIKGLALDRARRAIGILRHSDNLATVIEKLTDYFRSFEAKDSPPDTGNVYRDLVNSQAGVCRHRAFAFMVTANALGIPTRYLTNEAHAFVEVWLPNANWVRVDLGGAAMQMQVDNASGKSLHQPRREDPFAKPESYEQNYTQLQGDIEGLTSEQLDEGKEALEGGGAGNGSSTFDPGTPEIDDAGESNAAVSPSPSLEATAEPDPDKLPTEIAIRDVASQGFRGESLRVTGVLVGGRGDDARGIDGQRVDIWLAPPGQGGEDPIHVGRTFSGAEGVFTTNVELPEDIVIGSYEVYVTTTGDSRYNDSSSN